MRFVPRKELAQWYTEGYGGEQKFHADILAEVGETVIEVLAEAMRPNVYLNTPLHDGATIHFEISINDSEVRE